jgi:hypothetical protein
VCGCVSERERETVLIHFDCLCFRPLLFPITLATTAFLFNYEINTIEETYNY